MAYREYGMWEILEVLRRHARGERRRAIARATGHSRKTVARYIKRAEGCGWDGRSEPTEELAMQVAARVQPGPAPAGPGEAQARLLVHRAQIQAWLTPDDGKRGLTLTRIHELLAGRGVEVGYTSLRRFVAQRCDLPSRRSTVRLVDVPPGELAEIDFGRLGLLWDPETGRDRVVHALIVTLVHSRHMYLHLTFSQRLADVIDGLEDAWEFFGGVPRRVILDNLKPAVAKADRYEPIYQRTISEYARHRGFVLDAAVPRHPTGKPHVERMVPYARERFFRGADLRRGLEHARGEAVRWCVEVAGRRVHGTTRKIPLEVFEAVEKPALLPLTGGRFDPPQWAECKVHRDLCIQFQQALYSVPAAHLGKTVTVRGDRGLVRIFLKGQLVKTHPTQPPGGKSLDPADYPPERAAYAMRDVDGTIRRARAHGEHIGQMMARLLSGTVPWSKLRAGEKLLRLVRRYGAARVDAACRRALAFDLVDVRRVQTILVSGAAAAGDPVPPTGGTVHTHPRFLRPHGSFTHTESDHGDQPLSDHHPQAPQALEDPADPA